MHTRTFVVAVLAVAGLAAGCTDDVGFGSDTGEIIGGQVTADGEYPGVGALMLHGHAGCTGTLIAPDVVLTAGHCLDPQMVGSNPPGFTLSHNTLGGHPHVYAGR